MGKILKDINLIPDGDIPQDKGLPPGQILQWDYAGNA